LYICRRGAYCFRKSGCKWEGIYNHGGI